MEQPKGPFCQSCAMPLEGPADCGTEADGTESELYCHFCFQRGEFTEPEITMEQMIDKCAQIVATKMRMPETQARQMMGTFIPMLARWRGK